jgi:cholera toxin transcriptional activator
MAPRVFRFGIFELRDSTGELRKDGRIEPRLRDQSLQLLVSLLERPREVVTREELHRRLWPSDTFVDFDHGLNTAVNQLRLALGDSASNPRFIQTLPRKGYRFIAPVEIASEPEGTSSHVGESESAAARGEIRSVLSDPRELPRAASGTVRVLFGLIQLMYLIFYAFTLARLAEVEAIVSVAGAAAHWIWVGLIVTAVAGIPVRLYLLAAAGFNYQGLTGKFLKLFPFIFPLDELWALAPFLLVGSIGVGLAMATTAALLYLPFAQRSLLLMGLAPENKNAQV